MNKSNNKSKQNQIYSIKNHKNKSKQKSSKSSKKSKVNRPEHAKDYPDRKTIFIGGVFWGPKKQDLLSYFEKFGKVFSLEINKPKEKKNKKKKSKCQILGSAFLVVENKAFDNIIMTNPHRFNGRILDCKEYHWDIKKRKKSAEQVVNATLNLYDLPPKLTQDDIIEFFQQFGKLRNAYILPERDSVGKLTDRAKVIFIKTEDAIGVEQMARQGHLQWEQYPGLSSLIRGKAPKNLTSIGSCKISSTLKSQSELSIFESTISDLDTISPKKMKDINHLIFKSKRKLSCTQTIVSTQDITPNSVKKRGRFFSTEKIIVAPQTPSLKRVFEFHDFKPEIHNFQSMRDIKKSPTKVAPKSKFFAHSMKFFEERHSQPRKFNLGEFLEEELRSAKGEDSRSQTSKKSNYSYF